MMFWQATDLGVIFGLPFMRHGLIAVVLLSIAAGVVGLFINFRELEFVSDGLVHAVFPGLVMGMLVGGTAGLLPGAVAASLFAALLFALLSGSGGGTTAGRDGHRGARATGTPGAASARDAGIAVALTGLFSLGVVLISRSESYVSQLQELLFGRILTVTVAQLWQIGVVAAAAILLVWLGRRVLLYRAFDPAGFEAAGFSSFRADLALNVAVALLVVAGVQALGVLMVIAILVVPMAVARLLSRRLRLLIPIAILVTFAAGFTGLWVSFVWSVRGSVSASPGALIVLLLVVIYAVAIAVSYVVRGSARLRANRTAESAQRVPGRQEVAR